MQYPVVKAEIEAIQSGMESYANAHAVQPASGIKEKIFQRIIDPDAAANQDKPAMTGRPLAEIKLRSVPVSWKWGAAAAVLLIIASTLSDILFYNKYVSANNELTAVRDQLDSEKLKAGEMKHDMSVVHNPLSMPVALKGMEQMPDATAKIFWLQNTGEVMIDASNLPNAPQGSQYQFWAIVDGIPVNGGMIITNDKGIKYRFQKMRSFGKAQAFAISLEKEGGSPAPTKVVSMGKV